MVGTIAIAKAQPSKSLDFKCFWISDGWISDPHCIQLANQTFEICSLIKLRPNCPVRVLKGPNI